MQAFQKLGSVGVSFLGAFVLLATGARSASAACNPGPDQVAVFADVNFGGACAVLGVGAFGSAALGIPNDALSSLKVGGNVRAILFENDGFQGREANYELGDWSGVGTVNEKTSSVIVQALHLPTVYLGNAPSIGARSWTREVQGIAHSDGESAWYITQNVPGPRLWKAAFSVNLATSFSCAAPPAGVRCSELPPHLQGYDHFGDADVFGNHVLIPVEGPGLAPRLAVFRASDLRFEGWDFMFAQAKAGWLAVEPITFRLFASDSDIRNADGARLLSYPLDLGRLCVDGPGPDGSNQACWLLPGDPELRNLTRRDGASVNLITMQGGAFSPDGAQLFLSNGGAQCVGGDGQGLRVFDVATGSLLAKSESDYGPFSAQVRCGGLTTEEFEGIDFGAVPGFPGFLHALVLDNELLNNDRVFFKHYEF